MGLSFFKRASDRSIKLVSYHPRASQTWHWAVYLRKTEYWLPWGAKYKDPWRTNQWHDAYGLPFNLELVVSRQDYHKAKGGGA